VAVKRIRSTREIFKKLNKPICLVVLAVFAVVSVVCAGYRISNKIKLAEYETQIAEMEAKVQKLSEENDEYTAVLNSSDRRAYYEKIARELHGYGKPGEYVFYITP